MINKMNERRQIGIIPIVAESTLYPTLQGCEEYNEHAIHMLKRPIEQAERPMRGRAQSAIPNQ